MSLSDDLYKEVILEHYENPKNFGTLEKHTHHEHGVNPLCGDEFEIFMLIEKGKISSVKFQGKGCSISMASSSMMCESIEGKTVEEAKELISKFKVKILEDKVSEPFDDEYSDLDSIMGVKKYPVRVKCAVLPWNTLERAIGV